MGKVIPIYLVAVYAIIFIFAKGTSGQGALMLLFHAFFFVPRRMPAAAYTESIVTGGN